MKAKRTSVVATVEVFSIGDLKERLATWCERTGTSMAALAELMGVRRQTLFLHLSGERVSMQFVRDLSAAMRVPLTFWIASFRDQFPPKSLTQRIREELAAEIDRALSVAEEIYGPPESIP